jgi:hypothetical protein
MKRPGRFYGKCAEDDVVQYGSMIVEGGNLTRFLQ